MIQQREETSWQRQRRIATEEAQARADAIARENAYWFAQAALVQARESAERERSKRQRAEVIEHLSDPANVARIVMARATMNLPVLAADGKVPKRFCWMPRGAHDISAGNGSGGTWSGTVICDEVASKLVMNSFAELTRDGWRCYVDLQHREGEAAGWVGGFSWDPAVGIMCAVDWTPLGEGLIRDHVFTSFSPTFLISNETGRVTGLVPGRAAGALVNNPAFGKAMPPILAGAAMGEAMRQALLSNGHSAPTADAVANAIAAGHSPDAIRVLIQALSS